MTLYNIDLEKLTAEQSRHYSNYLKQVEIIISNMRANGIIINEEMIKSAYDFAFFKHKDGIRDSGEPYINHPVSVSMILSELKVDDITITAAMMHDIVEDTPTSREDIKSYYGTEVASIVESLTKIEKRLFKTYRKLLSGMMKDSRVLLIKMCDRIHNMRTIDSKKGIAKRLRTAAETREIFAPLAYYMGMYRFSRELDDLSFRTLDEANYNNIVLQLEKFKNTLDDLLEASNPSSMYSLIKSRLDKLGIPAMIEGRIKGVYSTFKELSTGNKSISDIYDIMAVVVVIPDEYKCHDVMGELHFLFDHLGFVDDYIAKPKKNGYRSLHTKVSIKRHNSNNFTPVEIQIRTKTMHEFAEYGSISKLISEYTNDVATVFMAKVSQILEPILQYDEALKSRSDIPEPDTAMKRKLASVREITVIERILGPANLVDGSNVIDLAYYFDENRGNKLVTAKIDQNVVPLDFVLQDRQNIELFFSENVSPKVEWLNVVKTEKARNCILTALKEVNIKKTIRIGKNIFEGELKKFSINFDDSIIHDILNCYKLNSLDDFYSLVGNGEIEPNNFIEKIIKNKKHSSFQSFMNNLINKINITSGHAGKESKKTRIYKKFTYPKCCMPLPGDEIKGQILPDGSVAIHHLNCPEIRSANSSKILLLNWETDYIEEFNDMAEFEAIFEVKSQDRQGLLSDMMKASSSLSINLSFAQVISENSIVISLFVGKFKNLNQFIKLRNKLLDIESVLSVERYSNKISVNEIIAETNKIMEKNVLITLDKKVKKEQ